MNISVIVPFYNEEQYIDQCIRSLIHQDFNRDEYELIFVNNGSTDHSEDIVRNYPDIILTKEKKRDVYAARNRALAIAKGDVIAFTDADCAVSQDWLTQIHQGMKEWNSHIVLGCRDFPDDASSILKYFQDYENAKAEYILNHGCRQNYYGYTNNMAILSGQFKKEGVFSEGYSTGDTEFLHRCISGHPSIRVHFLPRMRVNHLEVKTVGTWLTKLIDRGRQNRRVESVRSYQRLNLKTKLTIIRQCIHQNRYNLRKAVSFLLIMFLGDISYSLGRMRPLKGPSRIGES